MAKHHQQRLVVFSRESRLQSECVQRSQTVYLDRSNKCGSVEWRESVTWGWRESAWKRKVEAPFWVPGMMKPGEQRNFAAWRSVGFSCQGPSVANWLQFRGRMHSCPKRNEQGWVGEGCKQKTKKKVSTECLHLSNSSISPTSPCLAKSPHLARP